MVAKWADISQGPMARKPKPLLSMAQCISTRWMGKWMVHRTNSRTLLSIFRISLAGGG